MTPVGGDVDVLAARLAPALGERMRRRVPLAGFTTYRLGGPAAVFVDAASADDLLAVRAALAEAPSVPVLVVGRGSNLLVAERGFDGVAVHLGGEFETIEMGGEMVTAGGGVALPVLARQAAAAGRAGLEFYVGIPGSVGGAVRMNAGGHGRETCEVLARAWTVDLAVDGGGAAGLVERPAGALDFGYRHSGIAPTEVVVRAEFAVQRDDAEACERRISEIVQWRREHQPGGSNAGSVFRNPPGDSAGRLIDACGLKGHRVGGAEVSPKHANFFQAGKDATADDVRALVLDVQRRVEEATGVRLEPELKMVGFEGPGIEG
ncbi:MAG TPA: UDP-N-acetylmuramate dehydrogenase [Acidimicrobiia bacterium]|nr:UDP-N-acetylmuramate dehydrogenase [Acidimicrobiia bacterium]